MRAMVEPQAGSPTKPVLPLSGRWRLTQIVLTLVRPPLGLTLFETAIDILTDHGEDGRGLEELVKPFQKFRRRLLGDVVSGLDRAARDLVRAVRSPDG